MVDVHPQPAPTDAFDRHVADHPGRYRAAVALSRREYLEPAAGGALAAVLAGEIRIRAAQHRTTAVHLFLRAPFPLAVLLARGLNTLTVHAYEWDDTHKPDRYLPAVVLTPGHGDGPARAAGTTGPPPWTDLPWAPAPRPAPSAAQDPTPGDSA